MSSTAEEYLIIYDFEQGSLMFSQQPHVGQWMLSSLIKCIFMVWLFVVGSYEWNDFWASIPIWSKPKNLMVE